MGTFLAQGPVLATESSKTCGGQASFSSSPHETSSPVPHGVRVVQNGRPMLEDAFSQAVIDVVPLGGPQRGTSADLSALLCSAGLPQQHPQQHKQQPLAFFGVYDGHGGAEVAHHAAAKLHQHFQAAYRQLAAQLASSGSACSTDTAGGGSSLEDMLCDAWASNSTNSSSSSHDSMGPTGTSAQQAAGDLLSCSSPSSTSSSSGSPTCAQVWATINGAAAPRGSSLRQQQQQQPCRSSRVVVQALREAFLRTDADLAGTEVGEVVGTTAVTAVLSAHELFIGHCGDSRAVLCRKGMAVPLTDDHKPGRADEMARVGSLGGKVVFKAGSHRVMGLLAMSRALGDHFLRPYVIPEPEVLCLQRCPDDELLILATDGLWDVFSCQEATTLALRSTVRARQRGASAAAACRVGASVLVRGAVERGSRDNITVAVIDLRARAAGGWEGGGEGGCGGDGGGSGGFGGPCVASVASVLASQCSSDLAGYVLGRGSAGGVGAGGHSRKRRSSSGNGSDDDEDGQGPGQQPHGGSTSQHGSLSKASAAAAAGGGGSSSIGGKTPLPLTSSEAPAALGGGERGGVRAHGSSTTARRHTISNLGPSSSLSPLPVPNASSSGSSSRGTGQQGVAWGWSLQGLQLLPQSQDSPSSSIRALAQAAAAAVAAFSGKALNSAHRSESGIPRDVAGRAAAGGSAVAAPSPSRLAAAGPVAAAAGAPTAGQAAAAAGAGAAGGVVAPATPTMGELLSMQSAPALRHGPPRRASSSGGAGKPPLPQQYQQQQQRGA